MITLAIIYVVGVVLYGGLMVWLVRFDRTTSEVTGSQIAVAIAATVFWPITILIQTCLLAYGFWELYRWSRY